MAIVQNLVKSDVLGQGMRVENVGVVTLEDVIEALIKEEIQDENDHEDEENEEELVKKYRKKHPFKTKPHIDDQQAKAAAAFLSGAHPQVFGAEVLSYSALISLLRNSPLMYRSPRYYAADAAEAVSLAAQTVRSRVYVRSVLFLLLPSAAFPCNNIVKAALHPERLDRLDESDEYGSKSLRESKKGKEVSRSRRGSDDGKTNLNEDVYGQFMQSGTPSLSKLILLYIFCTSSLTFCFCFLFRQAVWILLAGALGIDYGVCFETRGAFSLNFPSMACLKTCCALSLNLKSALGI